MKADEREKGDRHEPEPHQAELPELAVRILSDFARVVAAEARLLEANMIGAAQSLLDRVYVAAILIVLAATGVVAILAGIGLLLHQWMPWWQALGLLGVCAIVVAEAFRRRWISTGAPQPEPPAQA
jgi:hypothetical protein